MAGAALVITVLTLLASNPAGPGGLLPTASSLSNVQLAGSGPCNPSYSLAPSSLYVTQPEPTVNLLPNGTIKSFLSYEVVNYTSADSSVKLWFPSTDFTFPMTSGGNFSYAISPQFVNVTGPGWSNLSSLSKSEVVANGINFVPNGTARLSSQKLAIMATADYGTLQVEFRWHWSLLQPGALRPVVHAWSIPTASQHGVHNLPSIFFPAPYVSNPGGTGQYAYIGTNWVGTLGGDVAGRGFFLEMEYGGGFRVQSQLETAPLNVSSFNVTLPILNYNSYLVPGNLLIHIHDTCGALLYNKVLRASFAPNATVSFDVQPACGSVNFNGTKYANGTSAIVVPRLMPYNFSVPNCKGLKFNGWQTTGALHITSGHGLEVSYNGTFIVKYT